MMPQEWRATEQEITMVSYVTKRDDTHMGTIEKQYNRDFGVRSDKELGNYLKENNIASLNDLIHSDKGKK